MRIKLGRENFITETVLTYFCLHKYFPHNMCPSNHKENATIIFLEYS